LYVKEVEGSGRKWKQKEAKEPEETKGNKLKLKETY
jgi:hypothetical protein